jgi:YegS/Rv2252/BmrU family lipid kinase
MTAASSRRVLVIHNPMAGRRDRGRLKRVLAHLQALGCRVSVHTTQSAGATHALPAAMPPGGIDVIAIAGGDGTVNDVVNAMTADHPPLAVIPLGTANVMAIELRMPKSPRRIAEVIARGRPTPLYLGRANGRRFVLMAGVGLDARIVANVDSRLKRRLGKGAYVWQALVELYRDKAPRLRLTIDGTAHEAASAIVANSHYYGGPMVCAPDAWLDRPGFQVCLFGRGRRRDVLRYGAALLLGRLADLSDVKLVAATTVTIEAPAGEPVQVDGDNAGSVPMTITAEPVPLSVLRPR